MVSKEEIDSLIADETEAISRYESALESEPNYDQKFVFSKILEQEKEHKKMLEDLEGGSDAEEEIVEATSKEEFII